MTTAGWCARSGGHFEPRVSWSRAAGSAQQLFDNMSHDEPACVLLDFLSARPERPRDSAEAEEGSDAAHHFPDRERQRSGVG